MQIYGLNATPPDKWGHNDNVFRIDGMTSEEYKNAGKGGYKKFWGIRDATLERHFGQIWNSTSIGQVPLDQMYNLTNSVYTSDIAQLTSAMPQWETFGQIRTNGGRAVGFDLETLGDVTNKDIFGITEIALGTRDYDGAGNVKVDSHSYAVRLNQNQSNYLKRLVDRFESDGWDTLTSNEQVALKRMSMYGSSQIQYVDDGPMKGLYEVTQLGPERINAMYMRQGITNLSTIGTSQKTTILRVADALVNQNADVYFGANSNFDVTGLIRALQETDSTWTDVEKAQAQALVKQIQGIQSNGILDVIYAPRALAGLENESVNTYLQNATGVRVGASVDSQLGAYMFTAEQTHLGSLDINNEGDLLEIYGDTVNMHRKQINQATSARITQSKPGVAQVGSDNLFFFNRGSLDKRNAMEFAVIGSNTDARFATPNYSITNEYWTINEARTGYVDIDGQRKFVMSFDSYADTLTDSPVTSFTLVRDTQEEAFEYVSTHATAFNKRNILDREAIAQQSFKYKDFGRREFDKLLSPSEVRMDGNKTANGFDELVRYMKLQDEFKAKGIDGITPDHDSVMRLMEANGKKKKYFNSYYEAQSFAAMWGKLENERPLLESIQSQINANKTLMNAKNIDRTIAFNRAYNSALNMMTEATGGIHQPNARTARTISDALGIDIELDGVTHRINGYSAGTASTDINRIFQGLTKRGIDKEGMQGILDTLNSRSILSADDYDILTSMLQKDIRTRDDVYAFSRDVGVKIAGTTRAYMEDSLGRPRSPINASLKDSAETTTRSLGVDVEAERMISFNRGRSNRTISFGEVFQANQDAINLDIAGKIASQPIAVYSQFGKAGSSPKTLKADITKIAKELNITSSADIDLLTEMFVGYEKVPGGKGVRYKDYALASAQDKGMVSFFVKPDESSSAYIFMTRQQDANRFYDALVGGQFNFKSRKDLIRSGINDYAAFEEISRFNRYALDEFDPVTGKAIQGPRHYITTVNQSPTFEKILVPGLHTHTYSANGRAVMNMYYNDAAYDYLASHRKVGAKMIEHVLNGDYTQATRTVRQQQNAFLKDMSASSSYRGYRLADGSIRRITNYTPSDFIQGYEVRAVNELREVFQHAVLNGGIDPTDLTVAQQVVMQFGRTIGVQDFSGDLGAHFQSIMSDKTFEEFFAKRLFIGNVGEDWAMQYGNSPLYGDAFNRNLYSIILEEVEKDANRPDGMNIFGKSVTTSLQKLNIDPARVNQVLGETATAKGLVSVGVRPGSYNDASSLYSTMRPTYIQQNNGMMFNIEDIDVNKFAGLDNDMFTFQTTVLTEQERLNRYNIGRSGMTAPDGRAYGAQERNFVIKARQMSDRELWEKYTQMSDNAEEVAARLGIDIDEYNAGLKYYQQDIMSLYEGKLVIAPGLNEQELFRQREATKVELDINAHPEIVDNLQRYIDEGRVLDSNTVIGRYKDKHGRNAGVMFWDGPETIMEQRDLDELIDNATREEYYTRVIPLGAGDITDDKMMLNGAEKGTTHSVDVKSFAKALGLDVSDGIDASTRQANLDHALLVANRMFNEISGGAGVFGKLKWYNHANMGGVHSQWIAITNAYTKAGKGNELVTWLNTQIANNATGFEGLEKFSWDGKRIYSNSENARNFAYTVDRVYEAIANNELGTASLNGQIIADYEEMKAKGLYYAVAQRQTMNEHMGKRMIIDQRIEQGIVTRGIMRDRDWNAEASGVNPSDIEYMEESRRLSKAYNGRGDNGFDKELQAYIDTYSRSKNHDRISLVRAQDDMTDGAKGLFESLEYMYNPEAWGEDAIAGTKGKMVHININELIESEYRVKAGMSVAELQDIAFFIDGEPTELLRSLAEKQGVDLHQSYSMFIDMNGIEAVTEIGDASKTYAQGFVVPMPHGTSMRDDKLFWQGHQKAYAKFVNDIIDITVNPRGRDYAAIGTALGNAYHEYAETIADQLAYLDKDSALYKQFNQYFAPNSRQFLAQDEASPLVKSVMQDDMLKRFHLKEELEKAIYNGDVTNKRILQYARVTEDIQTRLDAIANRILDDNDYYDELVSLSAHPNLDNASTFIDVNGRKHYGLAVAVNETALESMGFDLGVIGMDVINDYENHDYYDDMRMPGMKEFDDRHWIAGYQEDIARQLNDLHINGLEIDADKPIMEQLNAFVAEKYADQGLNIRSINEAIARGEHKSILGVFRSVGMDYMSEIGSYGEVFRYPQFRQQPFTKVILDRTMENGKFQLRASNALLSLLSHVDFDGDTQFLRMLSDGMSVLKTDSRAYQLSQEGWERFAQTESRKLMAEMVRNQNEYFTNDIHNDTIQRAKLMKNIADEEYDAAIDAWMTSHGIDLDGLDDSVKDAYIFAAESSPEMRIRFNQLEMNTLTREDSIIASIAARLRKGNIGSISTPNYTVRDAILKAMDELGGLGGHDEEIMLLNQTFHDLTNMSSEAGGFFSLGEQKAIDPKHAKDGKQVARTTRYSAGLSKIFSKNAKKTADDVAEGVYDMILAVGQPVFGIKNAEQARAYANLVMSLNSRHDVTAAIQVLEEAKRASQDAMAAKNKAYAKQLAKTKYVLNGMEFSVKDLSLLYGLRGIRGLVEIDRTVANFSYKDAIVKGSLDETLYDAMQQLTGSDVKYQRSALNHIMNAIGDDYHSQQGSPFTKNEVYLRSGRLGDEVGHQLFVWNGKQFDEIDIEGKIVKRNVGRFSPKYFNNRGFQGSAGKLRVDASVRAQASRALQQGRIAESLNNVMFNTKSGRLNQNFRYGLVAGNPKGKGLQDIQRIVFQNDDEFDYIASAFRVRDMHKQVHRYAKAYDEAASRNMLAANAPSSSGELLRAMNEEIANSYTPGAKVEYEQMLRQKVLDALGGSEIALDEAMEYADALPDGFKKQLYDDALSFLNEESYDIMAEEARLNMSFDSVQSELDTYTGKQGASQKEVQGLKDIMGERSAKTSTLRQQMRTHNETTIKQTQNKIWQLFKNDTDTMAKYFRLNNPVANSVVGFGQYMGKTFSSLTAEEAGSIINTARRISGDSTEAVMATKTVQALLAYRDKHSFASHSSVGFAKANQAIDKEITRHTAAKQAVYDKINQRTVEQARKAMERATEQAKAKGTQKKTLTGSAIDSVKGFDFSKIPMKGVAIGAASLAALGIVNNLLHNDKKSSPLSPKRTDDRDNPNYDNGYGNQAPASRRQTVYADNSSGIQFKVSAKTQNYINARNNAQLIGMAGAGNAQIHTSYDNTGVTDNWLANKFAELT